MNRYVTGLAVATCLALMTGPVAARGPSVPYPVEIYGKVREVDMQQLVIVLDDGTNLAATSPLQLDRVEPGSAVRILFVEGGARKEIQRVYITP